MLNASQRSVTMFNWPLACKIMIDFTKRLRDFLKVQHTVYNLILTIESKGHGPGQNDIS